MRHWKFSTLNDIDEVGILSYIEEAIENEKKGLKLKPSPRKEIIIPKLLKGVLAEDSKLNEQFNTLAPYKQRIYCEHITEAKQQKTKESRIKKIIPMISKGIGLYDKYK